MRPFSIEHIQVDPPVALAPMEGVTDRNVRRMIRSLGGCGLTVTEFVSSEALTRDVEAAWRMAELDPDEHPVSIQIYGRDPQRMADAARHCQALGADVVDINLGCPSKKVTSGCAGSALMKEPERAREIFDAVYEAIDVPMTVKMRLGWDNDNLNAAQIARSAEQAGAKMVAVHGRTRMQSYSGHARWEEIRPVRDAVGIPLLVNGDIIDVESATQALELSGADGVMVGRGIMRDPWCLRRISCAFRGETFIEPTLLERRDTLLGFLATLDDFKPASALKLKKVATWFSKGLPHAAKLRSEMQRVHSEEDAARLIHAYFGSLLSDARPDEAIREHVAARSEAQLAT